MNLNRFILVNLAMGLLSATNSLAASGTAPNPGETLPNVDLTKAPITDHSARQRFATEFNHLLGQCAAIDRTYPPIAADDAAYIKNLCARLQQAN